MYDDPHVGCGVWPLILTDTVFQPACAWHDSAYTTDSAEQQALTREQVDKGFLERMLEIVEGAAEEGSIEKAVLTTQAYSFYEIARRLGGVFWEGSQYYKPLDVPTLIAKLSEFKLEFLNGRLIQVPT